MPNHDIKNSTLASKVMFWTLPLIKCKTHQIWPTLKWKSWFFRFFSSFFTKNPCFPDKFYPSKKNPRNYNPMHIDIFFKIFTPAIQGCPNSRPGRHTYQWQCSCPCVLPRSDILGIDWNKARSELQCCLEPSPGNTSHKGERGCSCSVFPSRPKWSLGHAGPSDWTA